MRGFGGRCTARGTKRRGAPRIATVFLLGVALTACGAVAPGHGSNALTPDDWVHRGISLFRSATSVLVIPDADGEGFCGNVQPSCAAYTITQSPTSTAGVARSCDTIPSCATTFFTPIEGGLEFEESLPSEVDVAGDTPGCQGWCVWRMVFDRSSGVITAVDIYLRGGSHQVWPTWRFADYVVNGSTLATPTPAPTLAPKPSHSSATTPGV